MNHRSIVALSLVGALFIAGCGEEDRRQAEAGVEWLQQRRLFHRFGDIGEITRITAASAELIRMEITIPDPRNAEAIDGQSLMRQSLIAEFACPGKDSELWSIIGVAVTLRVDLTTGEKPISSAICGPE